MAHQVVVDVVCKGVGRFAGGRRCTAQAGDGCKASILDATWCDHVEPGPVGVEVYRNSVHGYTASKVHPDRANLFVVDPNAWKPTTPLGANIVVSEPLDYRTFHHTDCALHPQTTGPCIDDWVRDQLTGSMKCCETTSVGVHEVDAILLHGFMTWEVGHRSPACRDHRIMLQEPQNLIRSSFDNSGSAGFLTFKRRRVGNASQP